MASRENQGLHFALILLVMLTIVLCVITFLFYSKSAQLTTDLESARSQADTFRQDSETAGFKVQALQFMIKGDTRTWDDLQEEMADLPAAATSDTTMQEIRRNFENNMKLFPAQLAGEETALNYQSLPGFLLSRIRDLNLQLTDLRRSESQLTQDKLNIETAANDRVKQAEAERDKARADLATEREKFTTDLADVRKQMESINEDLGKKDEEIRTLTDTLASERESYTKRVADLTQTVDNMKLKIRSWERTSFEVPDGLVTNVNQKEGVLYLNIGSADNLKPQQTFSVYDKEMTGVMDAKPKGRIEVLQVLGEHLAMARILEDQVSNVIVPNDVVFTPAWSPGERIHFAIAGIIDMSGTGQDESDLLRRLIELNGGVVDDTVEVQTRYLIVGEQTVDSSDTGAGVGSDFNDKMAAAIEIGVDRISTQKLLSAMGWKADVSTVTLGTGKGRTDSGAAEADTSPFRKRTPPRGPDGAF